MELVDQPHAGNCVASRCLRRKAPKMQRNYQQSSLPPGSDDSVMSALREYNVSYIPDRESGSETRNPFLKRNSN